MNEYVKMDIEIYQMLENDRKALKEQNADLRAEIEAKEYINRAYMATVDMLQSELDRYKKAEEEGRYKMIPCEPFTNVFVIEDGQLYCGIVNRFIVSEYTTYAEIDIDRHVISCAIESFGKKVFLDSASAEAAIGGKE